MIFLHFYVSDFDNRSYCFNTPLPHESMLAAGKLSCSLQIYLEREKIDFVKSSISHISGVLYFLLILLLTLGTTLKRGA